MSRNLRFTAAVTVSLGIFIYASFDLRSAGWVSAAGQAENLNRGDPPAGLNDQDWDLILTELTDDEEFGILHASDAQTTDRFGNPIVLSGDTLVIGAPVEDGGPGNPAIDSGAVYIFERDLGGPDNWGEAAILHASDAQAGDIFGYSVALSGDTLAVGATFEDGGPGNPAANSGAVYIFERDLGGPENWGEAAILYASDAQASDHFGYSAALSGDMLVVGAPLEDGGPGNPVLDSGAMYIFERDLGGPENWGEAAILYASDGQASDYFGSEIILNGDTLAVGVNSEDGGPGNPAIDSGAVYIFERDLGGPDNWGEAAILHASDAQADDSFGFSVAFSGDTLAVGSYLEDGEHGDRTINSGAAYVFERNLGGPDNWGEAAILHASDAQFGDFFGYSVFLSGDTLAVGAIIEDGGPGNPATDSGAVYIFERDANGPDNWGEAAILHARDAQFGDFFGYSVSLSGDTLAIGAPLEDGGPGDPTFDAGAVYIFQTESYIFMPIVIRD